MKTQSQNSFITQVNDLKKVLFIEQTNENREMLLGMFGFLRNKLAHSEHGYNTWYEAVDKKELYKCFLKESSFANYLPNIGMIQKRGHWYVCIIQDLENVSYEHKGRYQITANKLTDFDRNEIFEKTNFFDLAIEHA